MERPRVRTREGQEVELEGYGQLRQEAATSGTGRLVAELFTRKLSGGVESVVEGYGIEKSSVSRLFVAASSNQLRLLFNDDWRIERIGESESLAIAC